MDGSGTLIPIFGSRGQCRVERCQIRATHSTHPAVMVEWGSDGFVLKDSFSEVTGFRYGPGFHIQPTWLQNSDPQQRAAVDLLPVKHQIAGLPDTAPLKAWNIIEGSHLYDGPRGIRIGPQARHTQLRTNAIHVDGEAVVDESARAESPAP